MDLAVLVLIPFLLALLLATPQYHAVPYQVRTWVNVAALGGVFFALLGYFPYIEAAALSQGAVVRVLEWVPELGVSLSWYLDGLSLLFGLIISGVGAGIFLYTGFYFDDEADGNRFSMWLMAFAGAMLGVVLAGNVVTMFILWELTSVTSFMLIGFKGAKYEDARWGARQAFLITGGGALALILGLILLGSMAGTISGQGGVLLEFADILTLEPSAFVAHPFYGVATVLIMLGAFTKSAQFPFHFWLPNAMSAPTPASAYLHSATMVKAGIYLLARVYPPLHGDTLWVMTLVSVGVFTMLLGAFFALGKRDLKGLLAYLTVSTLGAIVALLGLPAYEGMKAAMVMILAHSLYKAPLFLSVGTIEHSTGTRNLDELGGLRAYMPRTMLVVLVSVLSMAGLFPLFGFVAKEVLIDGFVLWGVGVGGAMTLFITLSALLTVTAGGILFWEAFIQQPKHELHYHESSRWLEATPIVLAACSVLFSGLVLFDVGLKPLLQTIVPKDIKLYLFPPDGFANTAFQLSTFALVVGAGLVVFRRFIVRWSGFPLVPTGTAMFRGFLWGVNLLGNQVVKSQNGQIRYYLVVIWAVLAFVLAVGGQLDSLLVRAWALVVYSEPTSEAMLKGVILGLACIAAIYSVIEKNHLNSVLSLGLVGYAIGVIFLLEPAPDVALVQFLVETLLTILTILMLGRISLTQRESVVKRLWEGRLRLIPQRTRYDDGTEKPRTLHLGVMRDLVIAVAVGVVVFIFTLTALVSRPQVDVSQGENLCDVLSYTPEATQRSSISVYHICNAYRELGGTDVVGSIVTDYRAMDTLIEIGVFAVAALGVFTLLTRGLRLSNPLSPRSKPEDYKDEFDPATIDDVQDARDISTPFTRFVSRIVFTLGFILAFAHINYGGVAPGDGFTAGAFLGLATALWYIVFGFKTAKERLKLFTPHRLLRVGLLLALLNGAVPMFFGGGFLGYLNYGKELGIEPILSDFNLKISTTLLYEIAIFLVVFGGFVMIIEAIAHPKFVERMDDKKVQDDAQAKSAGA